MMASLIFYSPLFFCLCRQASLNEAAERQYERAAGLRPDVSTGAARAVFRLSRKRRCTHVALHSDTVSRSCCSWPTQQNTDLFRILLKALICERTTKKTKKQNSSHRETSLVVYLFGGLGWIVAAQANGRVGWRGSPSCQRNTVEEVKSYYMLRLPGMNQSLQRENVHGLLAWKRLKKKPWSFPALICHVGPVK